jgi:hypothetical protein
MSGTPRQPKTFEISGVGRPAPFGPVQCGMPDLSDLAHPTMLIYILNSTFRGAGTLDISGSAYLRGFILVTDKAIFEYDAARASLQEFVETRTRHSVYFQTTWHLENCLHSTRRALRFVDRLRGTLGEAMSREEWRTIQSHERSIREVRDTVEHMDDKIAEGKITTEGYFIALSLSETGDAAEIGTLSITFIRLATLLRRLYALALVLADYRDPEPPALPNRA